MLKKILITAVLFFLTATLYAQLPAAWLGTWKGELNWYRTGADSAKKVQMMLRIQPADTAGQYTWQLVYGSASEDNRPYRLVPKDSNGIHWEVDENNGIKIDMYRSASGFSSAFTVMGTTIVNHYQLVGNTMEVSFVSYAAKPVSTSGQGTEESPTVDSYRVGSVQLATLRKE